MQFVQDKTICNKLDPQKKVIAYKKTLEESKTINTTKNF